MLRGGILSPLAWNLAFDDLLDCFNTSPVKAKGFADDAALVVCGPILNTLVQLGQEAINKARTFGDRHGLTFGANKTEAVIFTRKRLNTSTVPRLRIMWETT